MDLLRSTDYILIRVQSFKPSLSIEYGIELSDTIDNSDHTTPAAQIFPRIMEYSGKIKLFDQNL